MVRQLFPVDTFSVSGRLRLLNGNYVREARSPHAFGTPERCFSWGNQWAGDLKTLGFGEV
jgi:hypothetical protein